MLGVSELSWERGFVVCESDVADKVESALAEQSVSLRLVSLCGETAFAFAGRCLPSFDSALCFVCAVDGRNSGYSFRSPQTYRPSTLIPKLGLTFGITLGGDHARLLAESPKLATHWDALGPTSEIGSEGEFTAFRWDLDGCKIDHIRASSATHSLKSIQRWLSAHNIPHRVVLFDNGWPEVFGDLPETSDVFTGPATCLSLQWQSSSDEFCCVTANDAEFMVDGDDISDSQLWAL